jgi:hypothetical protein
MGCLRQYMQEQMLKNDKEKNLLVITKKFSSTKEKTNNVTKNLRKQNKNTVILQMVKDCSLGLVSYSQNNVACSEICNLRDTMDVDRYSRMLLLLPSFIMDVESVFDYRLNMEVCEFKNFSFCMP